MGGGDRAASTSAGVLSRRRALLAVALAIAIALALLLFFHHIRLSIKPSRFPFILDAEQKDDARGRGLEAWEVLLSLSAGTLIWRFRWRCAHLVHRLLVLRRADAKRCICIFVATAMFAAIILRRLVYPTTLCNKKSDGWMKTDVGYLRTHPNIQAEGISLRTLCSGRVWEPHVARAIDEHLYHQGRAIDVGAFVGYHTIRLAKAAAPFDVHAFEGRPPADLTANLRRNNAVNAHLQKEAIDEKWTLDKDLEKELLNGDKGPVAFAKVDCEGCELNFLRGARSILEKWHPVLVIEIQDDESRRSARLGGQQMRLPAGSREEVMGYLKGLGYTVESLKDEEGARTWDYLAFYL